NACLDSQHSYVIPSEVVEAVAAATACLFGSVVDTTTATTVAACVTQVRESFSPSRTAKAFA
ncbi:MAG TPA: hypothetical protein VGM62_18280, partial [Chthoniobacterales bacterium]